MLKDNLKRISDINGAFMIGFKYFFKNKCSAWERLLKKYTL